MRHLTSTAIWLTTAVWFGSLISVVSWFAPSTPDRFGEVESLSTIKAPSTLIFTEPGWLMVLSISAVFVRVRRCSWCSYSPPLPRALSTAGDAGWDEIGDIAGPWMRELPVLSGLGWTFGLESIQEIYRCCLVACLIPRVSGCLEASENGQGDSASSLFFCRTARYR